MWQLSPQIFKSGGTEGRTQRFARDVPGDVTVALEARERATVRASERHWKREAVLPGSVYAFSENGNRPLKSVHPR